MDSTNTSKITREQLREGIRQIAIVADQLDLNIDELTNLAFKMDKNKNGSLSQPEFVVAFMNRKTLCTDENLKVIYKNFNRAAVTKEDILNYLPSLDPKDDTLNNLNMITNNGMDSTTDWKDRFRLSEFTRIMNYI